MGADVNGGGNFVIVEGIDGSGKTTLAEQIVSTYDTNYHHVGPPRLDMSAFAEHAEYAMLFAADGRTVFDRFHLGCFAYGPIFRPQRDVEGIGDFYREDWNLLEVLIRNRCVLVHCDPGWDVVRKEWKRRHASGNTTSVAFAEYERDIDVLRNVYDRFHKAYEFSRLHKLTYDYRKDGAWENLREVLYHFLDWV